MTNNMNDPVLDLSNVYGYARLYKTLSADGVIGSRTLADKMYGWYCSNIAAYNEKSGGNLVPLEAEIFYYKLNTAHVAPYKTNIQTIKALRLLEWNMSDRPEHASAQRELSELCHDYLQMFENEYSYPATNSITSYSLCDNTLDPEHEPENNLNPSALVRKYDTGPKLVYICAPLRGDIENNIEFAKSKAKEVFLEGNIPICPHLMFPPIADPNNTAEDKAALEMCMKLIDRCSEIRIYGGEWTEGMWQEIRHAEQMKVPVYTDQKEIPKTKKVERAR